MACHSPVRAQARTNPAHVFSAVRARIPGSGAGIRRGCAAPKDLVWSLLARQGQDKEPHRGPTDKGSSDTPRYSLGSARSSTRGTHGPGTPGSGSWSIVWPPDRGNSERRCQVGHRALGCMPNAVPASSLSPTQPPEGLCPWAWHSSRPTPLTPDFQQVSRHRPYTCSGYCS